MKSERVRNATISKFWACWLPEMNLMNQIFNIHKSSVNNNNLLSFFKRSDLISTSLSIIDTQVIFLKGIDIFFPFIQTQQVYCFIEIASPFLPCPIKWNSSKDRSPPRYHYCIRESHLRHTRSSALREKIGWFP